MNQRRNRRGIAMVWTAIVLTVMIGMVGLSIDWGLLVWDAHQLQNAGDAAALAGAMGVKKAFNDGEVSLAYKRAWTLAMMNRANGAPVDVCYDDVTNDPALDVVVGRWFPQARIFDPFSLANPEPPNAVKVVPRNVTGWAVNQPVSLLFGPIFGTNTANVSREAIAMAYGGGGAGLVCLDPFRPGLVLNGASKVAVYGVKGAVGEIYVNSEMDGPTPNTWAVVPGSNSPVTDEAILEDPVALNAQSKWAIYCSQLNVCGEPAPIIAESYSAEGSLIYPVIAPAPPIEDPLEDLPPLDPLPADGYAVQVDATTGEPLLDASGKYIPVVGLDANNTITSSDLDAGDPGVAQIAGVPTLTLAPGYYSGGFRLTSGGTYKLRLLPGVYAVGGGNPAAGLVVSGGQFEALGVMMYVTDSKAGVPGRVSLNGSESNGAQIHISEYKGVAGDPASYEPYAEAGMAIFQDHDNDSAANFTGGSMSSFEGTLYFHNDPHDGSGYNTQVELSGNTGNIGIQLITDRVLVSGTNSMVTIMYDGRNFKPAKKVALVK